MENIVIGIEGTVGSGKTSISRGLLEKIENSIILHGGNIYRAIVYGMIELKDISQGLENLDIFEVMKQLEIEIKIENRETVIYRRGEKIQEEDLQCAKISLAVSQVSNKANNEKLYQFGRKLIDTYREDYNVILSSRDIIKMYPAVTYHFFIDASIEERTNRKYKQYHKKIAKEEIRKMLEERDRLQEKTGYYKIYPQTKRIDVTECKNVKEATEKVFQYIK